MAEHLPEKIVAEQRMGMSSVSVHERNNGDVGANLSVWARVYAERIHAVNRNMASKVTLQVQLDDAGHQIRATPRIIVYRQTIGPHAEYPPVTAWLQSRLLP